MIAAVIVDIAHANVDRIFEYALPQGLPVSPGQRVLVPFGKGDRPTEGFVVRLSEVRGHTAGSLKTVLRTLEPYPALTTEQLSLCEWLREHYDCLLIDALSLMIPAQMRGLKVREKSVKVFSLALDEAGLAAALLSITKKDGSCRAPLQRDVLQLLANCQGALSARDLCAMAPGCENALPALLKKGWVHQNDAQVRRVPYAALPEESVRPRPTAAQQQVINAVNAGGAFLLHGVTGSGKTEVYMRCAEHAAQAGKSAIVLVPEISLTPQTVERFRGRFGARVAVLHSRLSSGERFDEWKRIRMGEVSVVVGARSAVFAPLENLGLIVIDEEHESSYASEHTPRYDAYTVAQKRRELTGATLLLGSATPSIESYSRAQNGELTLLTLKERVNRRPLPKVSIVDMRAELAEGNRSIFSAPLYRALKKCLAESNQAILFLNRRGYSSFVSCRGCGYVIKCPHCSVSLTYHKTDSSLRCHYCGYQASLPETCPHCGKPYLKYFGAGTQQVEEAVQHFFPSARVLRMDRDTTQQKDAHLRILSAFKRHEADILIGTQMITKGLDFPQVTLVGIIAADASLHVPDYRSAERTFCLITQVAGRAGRDAMPDEVYLQTYSPEHPAVRCAARHDYESFYHYEIGVRRDCRFPPFADFIRFLFESEDYAQAKEQAEAFRQLALNKMQRLLAEQNLPPSLIEYAYAMPAPIGRIREQFRFQLLVKLSRAPGSELLKAQLLALARERRKEGAFSHVEINPQNMM